MPVPVKVDVLLAGGTAGGERAPEFVSDDETFSLKFGEPGQDAVPKKSAVDARHATALERKANLAGGYL